MRLPMKRASLCLLALACATTAVFAQSAAEVPASALPHDVLIKNAIVMTVTHGNIKNGSVYMKDGKIAAVGEERECACQHYR